MSDDVKKLVPSVKVTRKETKVTTGTGKDKMTSRVALWDFEVFYPFDASDVDMQKTVNWVNSVIIAARKDAESKEART